MHILVTGNNGYIGPILTRLLLKGGYRVTGLDTNYYKECRFEEFNFNIKQFNKDIRHISQQDFKNIDAVIHLAALSNDPLGEFSQELTQNINYLATIKIASLAKKFGVNRFVFASSCSVYGISGEEITENSVTAPITSYAISKVESENSLLKMASKRFSPTILRLSTAYGVSPMLRCDIVLNNLVGWAFTTGKIRIMSDGTPWRPLIHVEDICKAFIACLEAPIELVHSETFNVGQKKENYQIKDIANAVKNAVPGCEVEYTNEHCDSRTYKVNFDKVSTKLKDFFRPKWDIGKGAMELYSAFKEHNLTFDEFNRYLRLNQLKRLLEQKKVDKNLFWFR